MTSNDAAVLSVTPRGTRPRNRRDQIRSAAAGLFYERGYEQVSIADVAESVNVGPSALYRHFSGKAELLFETIDQMIGSFAVGIEDLPDRNLDGIAVTAARTALAYRPLGVLWQREARNLPEPQLDVLRRHLRDAVLTLAGTVRDLRPELSPDEAEFLAACGVNAMSSISFHRLGITDEQVLVDLALRVLSYEFSGPVGPDLPRRPLPAAASRREEIADAAAVLFARHGYDSVGIDDVGAAVGMAGPSLYNHFDSKKDVLYASLGRGYALLQDSLRDASDGSPPPAVLRRVIESYVDLAHDHGDLIAHLITESRNLGDEYIGSWVSLVQELRPAEPLTVSLIKVQAAQMMASAVCRTLYLRDRPGFRRDLGQICWLLVA